MKKKDLMELKNKNIPAPVSVVFGEEKEID